MQAGDRAAAVEPLRAARDRGGAGRARPLLGEIDALARRARIELDEAAGAAVGDAPRRRRSTRLGLTPRELEVLLLVAAGPDEPRDRRASCS